MLRFFLFLLDIAIKILYNMFMKKYIIVLIFIGLIFSGSYCCPLYNTLGIPCPTCGITRAYKLFISGELSEALFMHPLFWIPPIFIFKPFQRKWLIASAIALFLLIYVIRLVLFFPHTPPMNYNYNSMLGVFFR